jgi:AraC-like DNA-binding protein
MTTPMARGTMLTGVIPLLEEKGLDVDVIVAASGVPREAFGDPNTLIPVEAGGRLLAAIERQGVTSFGLELGGRRKLADWGVLAQVASSQPTLREVIDKVGVYLPAQAEGFRLRLITDGETSELHCNLFHDIAWGALEQVVEAALGMLHRSFSGAMGGGWRPLVICFRHARHSPAHLYAKVFGTQVMFDQAFDGFLLDSADLDDAAPNADPMAAGAAEKASRPYIARQTLADRVTELAILLLPDGRCTASEIAGLLGLHVRTLQRRLAEEGATLAELADDARQRMSRAFVDSSNRPLSEAAVQLGFASQAAFNHWHRQRFGATPSERRRAARALQAATPDGVAKAG